MSQYIKTTLLMVLSLAFSFLSAQNAGDTVTVNLVNSKILIISESEDDEWDFDDDIIKNEKTISPGTELFFGTNGYFSSSNKLALPEEQKNMQINYLRSRSFAFNIMIKGLNVFNKRLYFSPGLGLCWNNYFFENPIQLFNLNDSTVFITDTITNFNKYKLSNTYLQMPLIIGLKIGNLEKKTFGIQVGIIAGYKIRSKIINHYEFNNSNFRSKEYNNFNVNPLQLSAIGRIKIGKLGVYAKYSITSLFVQNCAPIVYPFCAGLMIGGG